MRTVMQFDHLKVYYQPILELFSMIICISIGAGLITSSVKGFRDAGTGIVVITSLGAGVALYKIAKAYNDKGENEGSSPAAGNENVGILPAVENRHAPKVTDEL